MKGAYIVAGSILIAAGVGVGAAWWLTRLPQIPRCIYPTTRMSPIERQEFRERFGCQP
jgi:hypothetical protein